MNRIEFTKKIAELLLKMIEEGENPIGDYWKRSDEEQMHLYLEGKSSRDGIEKISAHQRGRALDIYFIGDDGRLAPPKKGWDYWHKRWEEMGGAPMIEWDRSHFE